MNMDMEYLLAWWEAEFALTVYYLWYVKSKWEKDGLTFGLITTKKQRILQHKKRIGTYVQFQGTDGPGIRPAYSTDMTVNGYTTVISMTMN
jgi:hypothetical protein